MNDNTDAIETVSNSMINTWQKCRHLYDLRFNRHLVPRIEAPYLRQGTLAHYGLEMGLRAQFRGEGTIEIMLAIDNSITAKYGEWADHELIKPVLEANPEIWDQAINDANDCKNIVQRVFDRFGIFTGRWETQTLDGEPLIEYKLKKILGASGETIAATGTLDWVAKDLSTGHTWLIDWKLRKQMMGDEYDETNRQASGYQNLLLEKGVKLNGTCSAQIRSAVPKKPRINTGKGKFQGQMSRSVIATDWVTYRLALLDAGLEPDDYKAMEDKLSHFEILSFTFRSPTEVRNAWSDYLDAIHEWAHNRHLGPFFRSLDAYNCKGCKYKDLCMEGLRDGDVDMLEQTLYMKDYEGPRSWMYGVPEEQEEGEES